MAVDLRHNEDGTIEFLVDFGDLVVVEIWWRERPKNKGTEYKEGEVEIGWITRKGSFCKKKGPTDMRHDEYIHGDIYEGRRGRSNQIPEDIKAALKKERGRSHTCVQKNRNGVGASHELRVGLGDEVKVKIKRYTGNLIWGYWPEEKSTTEIGTITAKGTWRRKRKTKGEGSPSSRGAGLRRPKGG